MSVASKRLKDYTIAILAVGLAAALRLLLRHFSLWDIPLLLFALPVVAVASYSGLETGLLAVVLGASVWTLFRTGPVPVSSFLLLLAGVALSGFASLLASEKRKTAEGERRASQQEKLLNLAHDAIIVRNTNGVILKWNAGATATYGWTEGEALGKVSQILFNTRFPVSAEAVAATLNEKGFWEGELRQTSRTGLEIVVESRQVLLRDDAGPPSHILMINREITWRKRAEEAMRRSESRFRSLLDANVIGVACGSAAGGIVEANDAFLKMTGYSRDDLQRGAAVWPENGSAASAPLEKDFVRKDGSRIPVLIFATAPESAPEQAVVLMVDLSERKMLEQKLLQKQKLETIGLLAAGVAHDFNNLLTSILMNSELAMESISPKNEARWMLEQVTREAQRAARLTSQLLAYAGKGGLTAKAIDLGAIIRLAVAETQDLISRDTPIRLELDAGLDPIEADRDQIRQLMTSLIVNAAEAIGDKRGGEITISTSTCTLGAEDEQWVSVSGENRVGAYALVRVRDNGCGMDGATLARVFDPFFTTKFLGRGLGLAAAQGIARAHNGAIRIVSAPGQGATVETVFPMPASESHPA